MSFSFGATKPAANGSLFGATGQNNAPAGQSTFGFSTPNPQQQQQPAQAGGLFGTQPAQPANPSSFSFGGPNPNNKQPFATNSTPSFGAPPQQQQPQSSLFGSTQAVPAPAGGLFGASTNQSQPQQGGGLFGASTTQPQQQQGGGLFGNMSTNQQPGATGSLFGAPAQQPTQPQGSLFGAAPQQQPQQTGSLFGLGQSQQPQQQQQSSMFSFNNSQQQQPQQQQGSSLFASTSGAPNTLGASMTGGSQRAEVDIGQRMQAVQRAWDTSSPDCRFKYYFYNVVEPGQAQQYGRPQGASDEAKWVKAVRENPNPTSQVPVLATGWADVKKRSQMQEQIASIHQQKIKEISQALTTLSRQSNITSSIRLSALHTHLTQLQHRLIRLAAQSPAFIPSLQSSALRPEEMETKKTLEGVKAEVDGKKGSAVVQLKGYGAGPGSGTSTPKKGGARMMGQVNELWGQVEDIRRHRGKRTGGGERDGWLADERVLGEVAEVLSTQQMALQKLNDLAANAVFDADVMRQGLGLISQHERNAS